MNPTEKLHRFSSQAEAQAHAAKLEGILKASGYEDRIRVSVVRLGTRCTVQAGLLRPLSD